MVRSNVAISIFMSQGCFSAEQKAIFLLYITGENTWSGLVVNDGGARGQGSPRISDVRGSSAPRFFPIANLVPGALYDPCFPIEDPKLTSTYQQPDPCQSRADLDDLMRDEDKELAQEDLCPRLVGDFFALLDLFFQFPSRGPRDLGWRRRVQG